MRRAEPANVDPGVAIVNVVCTDCDASASGIYLSHADEHAVFSRPCSCGGERILLRDLQRQARMGRKIGANP